MKLREIVTRIIIDSRKLTDYALNLENPVGRDKAVMFQRHWLSRTCSDKKISLMIRKACCLRLAGWVKVRSSTY